MTPRGQAEPTDGFEHGRIVVRLDQLLTDRQMTMTELAERVDITLANMSILKNGHARAVRFSTLTAICHILDCQPGEILTWEPPEEPT
ncbi:MAG: helix-turn-helix transcriptional regulator [Micrococcales bacterium]|nr:helix-turn-helix transcriptional regulator [Micrococcales bacterium]